MAEIHGTVAPGFEFVRRAFADNLEKHAEVDAACAVATRGCTGGSTALADRRRGFAAGDAMHRIAGVAADDSRAASLLQAVYTSIA